MKMSCTIVNHWHCSFSEMVLLYADVVSPHCYQSRRFCKLVLGTQVCLLCTPEKRVSLLKSLYIFVESLSITTKRCVLEQVFPPCGRICQGWQCGQEEGQNTSLVL